MNKSSIKPFRLLFILLVSLMSENAVAQFVDAFDIVSFNGKYSYSPTQIPDKLVPLYTNDGDFQWQSSESPTDGFTDIPGATNSEYVFTQPLVKTMYFRRKKNYNFFKRIFVKCYKTKCSF